MPAPIRFQEVLVRLLGYARKGYALIADDLRPVGAVLQDVKAKDPRFLPWVLEHPR